MKKQLLAALGLATLSIQHVQAQSMSSSLDSVLIKENRITEPYGKHNRNIEIMDSRQVLALPVKNVNELLSYVAGVDLRQRGPAGTQSDVSIDGSTFDQVLVLVNGVKMSDPQTGHHMLNLPIPLSAIDHIEIVRGPAARTYGIYALAGAINIVTKSPVKDEVFAQAYSGSSLKQDTATGKTYLGWGAQASASIAGKKQSHIISLSHDEGNGYRYNTGYNAYRLYYQNRININDKNSIEAMGGYINNDFGANAYYAAPVDAEATEKVQTALGSIKYTYKPSKKVSISPRVSYRYNNDDYIFVRQNPALYHNIHETNVLTGEVQSTIRLNKGIIGAGVEYRNEDINSTNLGKRQRNNLGIYAEYKHYFSDKLNASAGLYANKNSDYDWEVFPGVDAGYTITRNWKLFVNATTGQRLPTYTDLYYKGPANIGNTQLKPEYANYGEGGLQYDKQSIFVRAAYFYRRSTDFIDWVRATNTDPWQPQNFQTINTQGITMQSVIELGKLAHLSGNYDVKLNANYTYLSPVIESPTSEISKYAIEALRHQATVKLTSVLYKHVQANIAYRYLYRINANDYTLLDLRIGYTFKNILLYADVNNILDTQYKEVGAVPMPGRWMTIGARFNTVWK
ncbi:MAG: TonB-dependent receptor [Chitinophagaceae bacterium]|nr:TonB-dependent receptor [Chitinophagaceae bacterium]